jgi:transposase-like protein
MSKLSLFYSKEPVIMAHPVLDQKHFHDENAAYAYVEARIWPNGPVCPHCGGVDRIGKLQGKSTRIGVYKCYQCRKPFRATVGTVFEASHIPLRLWLQGIHLMASSKKGISSNQLHRVLGITLKSAWFMSHRIREAMRALNLEPMGGDGMVIEADETYIGRLEGVPKQKTGGAHKNIVLTLVERGGSARSFHVDSTSVADIAPIVRENVRRESRLHTDEARHYKEVGREYEEHGAINHGAYEYARGDITTNTVEGYYSIFKRGMKGIYQHCAEKHLHRYLSEFDFRYSNRVALGIDDVARSDRALKGIVGKRLTYKATDH